MRLLLSSVALLLALQALVTTQTGRIDVLSPGLFARVSDERPRVVMHIGPGTTPGSILVLTGHDAQEYDATGARVRLATFPDELWQPFPTRLLPTGPPRIVGIKSGFFRSWIDILDSDANRVGKLDGWKHGDVEVADVLGSTANEVLVRYRDGVAVLTEAGTRLLFIRSPRYLYQFRTIQLPGSDKRAIAMWMWIDRDRGVDVSVVRGDGSAVAAWHEDPSERINVFSLGGDEGEGLWSAVPGRFVERTVTGALRRFYEVPDQMRFRYLHGSALGGGRKVLVGSMGTVATLVCVFDAGGVLIAQSTLPSISLAFYVPDSNGTIFFVGSGEKVLRYDVSMLPGRPAVLP